MEKSQPLPLILKTDSLPERLLGVAREVEATLDSLLPQPTTQLHEAMRYSVLNGGKRIRSYLVWASSSLFDVPSSISLKVAAAIELIQAYSLVHDDLPSMDNADLRRGKPSCHKAFGEETAILVGDALIPRAFEVLADLPLSAEVRIELIKKLAEVIGSQGLVAGQMRDLGQEGPQSKREDVLELQRLKTGVLFGYATEVGAILGGASLEDCQTLRSFGLKVGQAFQMLDDWLDVHGNEADMGKACGKDTSKYTLLNFMDAEALKVKISSTLEEANLLLSPYERKVEHLLAIPAYIGKQIT